MAVLLPVLVARSALSIILGAFMGAVGLPPEWGSFIVYAVLGIVMAVLLPALVRGMNAKAWLLISLGAVLFLFGAARGEQFAGYYAMVAMDGLVGVGWFFAAVAAGDMHRCRRYVYPVGWVVLVATVLQLFVVSTGSVAGASYSQYVAYLVLPAVLIFSDAAFEKMAALNIAMAGTSALLMLSAGARGPLVVAALFVVVRVVAHERRSPFYIIGSAVAGIGLTWVALWGRNGVLRAIQSRLEQWGMSTRSLDRLIDGSLLEDNARSSLATHTFEIISQHPFLGVGMANERPLLARQMGASSVEEYLGWYPHNIVLEFWVQHGLVVGSVFLLAILVVIGRALLDRSNPDRRALTLLFVGLGILPLLVSGSYLNWSPFFGLIGLCIAPRSRPSRSQV